MLLLRWLFGLALFFTGLAAPAPAAANTGGTVAAITPNNRLQLADGTLLKIAGLQIPNSSASTAWLTTKLQGQAVHYKIHGTSPLHEAEAEIWTSERDSTSSLQESLLQAGLARVFITTGTTTLAQQLYAAEAAARTAKTGLWQKPRYAVLSADAIGQEKTGHLQIVEGTVQSVSTVGDTTYLNFGTDWRTDFTIAMAKPLAKTLDADLLLLAPVRVRGWLYWQNGPQIMLMHPAQLETLTKAP